MPIERISTTRQEQDDTVELPTLPRAPPLGGSESRLEATDTWNAMPMPASAAFEAPPHHISDTTTTHAVPILSEPIASPSLDATPMLPEPIVLEAIAPLVRPTIAVRVAPAPSLSSPVGVSSMPQRWSDSGHERAERYLEVLQGLEARRQLFDSMLGEREALISERDQRIASLEGALRVSRRAAPTEAPAPPSPPSPTQAETPAATDADDARALAALLEQAHLRADELERTVATLQAERDQWQVQYQVLQSEQGTLHAELIGLKADHGALRERSASNAVDAAWRAAALETQLRARDDTLNEVRGQLGTVRDALEQRNALIVRLEADIASNAGVIGDVPADDAEVEVEPTRMLVQAEGGVGRVQVLGRRTTVGRTPDNDMRIEADFVSRHHAVVLRHGDRTVLEDLNSTNGTYVNGQRISRCELHHGDQVTLGHSDFHFVIKAAESSAAP